MGEHLTGKEFWSKNKALRRPISPHLTIYKFQLTSMLSITHRGTGLAQSAMLTGAGLGALLLPGNFPLFLNDVAAMHFGGAIIFSTKFILAWPVMFHLWNGFRHLAWDMGPRSQRCTRLAGLWLDCLCCQHWVLLLCEK